MREIDYALMAELEDDLYILSRTIASIYHYLFYKANVESFDDQNWREGSATDLSKIEKNLTAVGLQGCISCMDVYGWLGNK